MPLEILLILVIGGIGAIAVLLHLTGRSRLRRMDMTTAGAAWLRQFPESEVKHITLSGDGLAALVFTTEDEAPVGLVWSFGDDTVARYLNPLVLRETKKGLQFRLPDFAAPEVSLQLTPEEKQNWQRLLRNEEAKPEGSLS
ncbi:hypothetical protein RSK20926_04192 [Roseobacter sp. SK209-2-6]|uniref:hypothetical protein n=1 Tax=Roseobacter sp. SK209-2-6 TaxID=388739 RepID=UPI0000F3D076|nr:hypothetical protein [Roseobacter sp. SK209-2-6]EBA15052.1 hypothetical protein RSK20926_04192 [Roseobacter sp. SK209-2-6]